MLHPISESSSGSRHRRKHVQRDILAHAKPTEAGFIWRQRGQFGWGYFGVDPIKRCRELAAPRTRVSPSIETIDVLLNSEELVHGDYTVPYTRGAFGCYNVEEINQEDAT